MSPSSEVFADLRSWQSKKAGLDGFKAHMRLIGDMARAAETLNVPPHYKAQAAAIEKLAGLQFARISGEADGNDAKALGDDLRDFAKIADGVVSAIGSYAASNFNSIDEKLFADVLSDGIDGNALYELETAGDRREQEIQEEINDGAHRVAAE
jgi:hypothetical protein